MAKALPFVDFVQGVLRVRLTTAQRALARVAVDGEALSSLTDDERIAGQFMFGCDDLPAQSWGVLVAVCGARSGKSYVLGALYSLYRALTADLSGLAPGERASALIVAPDMRLGKQVLRYALGAAKGCRSIAPLIKGDSADSFTIKRPDGHEVAIEVLPATRGGSALRGRTLVSAVLDEAAFFRDSDYAVNDTELYKAVSPRVLPGGLVVLASTPWVESGLLFDLFSKNHGAPVSALAARCPTIVMRDFDAGIEALIARETERDPDNAAREFGAEFMTAGGGLYFDPATIEESFSQLLKPRLVAPEHGRAFIGADLGLVRDSSAFVAVHSRDDSFVVAEVLELRPSKGNPLKLSEVCASLVDMGKRHGVRVALADHHLLEAAREHLGGSGFSLEPHAGGMAGKVESYHSLKEILASGMFQVPEEYRRLGEQLKRVVAKPTPGGGLTLSSPRTGGSHGDVASAAVLALWQARPRGSDMGAAMRSLMHDPERLARLLEGRGPLSLRAQMG